LRAVVNFAPPRFGGSGYVAIIPRKLIINIGKKSAFSEEIGEEQTTKRARKTATKRMGILLVAVFLALLVPPPLLKGARKVCFRLLWKFRPNRYSS